MISKSELIQFHYEFAMSIGTSLDLDKMLKKSLTTVLKKMNCPAGGVHFYEKGRDGLYQFKQIFTIPRDTAQISGYQSALHHISAEMSLQQLADFNKTLPFCGQVGSDTFHLLELPGLGLMVLVNNREIDSQFIASLDPILTKLAVACNACLQNEELIHHQNNLQELITQKTGELVDKNQLLTQEIDQRKRSEEAHRKSEEKYRELVQNANSIILRWDREGRVTFFNEYAQAFFGFSEDEIMGRHVVGTIAPKTETSGRDLRPLIDDICQNPEKYQYNVNENMRKDGTRVWVAWTNKILQDDDGNPLGALSIGADITEKIKAEQALQKAYNELQKARDTSEAANKAKSVFLANMSHELRTPLNAILGFSQMMSHNRNLNSDQIANLQIINRSGEHLLSLINDILDVTKIEAGRLSLNESDFNLYQLLDDVHDMFKIKAAEKGLEILCEHEPEVPQYVRSDETKLRQILVNLISNAVKFTRKGNVVVRVSALDDTSLKFSIADTGPGIAPDEIAHLFDPFAQTRAGKEAHEGTGLGLHISRKFVQLMEGDIIVRSDISQGTTFEFNVHVGIGNPLEAGMNEKENRRIIGIKPDALPIRILIVDDVSSNRQVLKQLLVPLHLEVKEAINGQEAIEIWKGWKPHLIWMDIRMPVMDGYEATRQIKNAPHGKDSLVIALSASAFDDKKDDALAAGCDGFIAKPFKESEIFETMKEHLGIQYVYEESTTDVTSQQQLNILSVETIKELPSEWKAEMKQAIEHVNLDQMNTLIEQLRKQSEGLADAIQQRIDRFEYDKILQRLGEH